MIRETALQILDEAFTDLYERSSESDRIVIKSAQEFFENPICDGCNRAEGSTHSCKNVQKFCERCIGYQLDDARNEGFDAGVADEKKKQDEK